MSYGTRSTKGCWTCRLRKKKCDEKSPTCIVCTSLALTCHGYGPKPDWMDGQAREREMAASIREIVKTAAKQKRRVAMLQRHEKSQSRAKSPSPTPLSQQSRIALETFPSLSHTSGSEEWNIQNANINSLNFITDSSQLVSQGTADDDQASLLMHYLDHVFPLQFRFYQPSAWDGGRGWLLITLMDTKPLYHAALSLAAYHRQSLLCQGVTDFKRVCFPMQALQEQHAIAIGELRQYLEEITSGTRTKSLVNNIKILCCIALLISLEVFTDSTENWRMHLYAASKVIADLKSDEMMEARRNLPASYQSALSFFASIISWYDILSYATTNAATFAQYDFPSAGLEFLRLDKVMGCENWAMLCILDINKLDEWKNTLQEAGELSTRELVKRAMDIESRLEKGLQSSADTLHTAHSQSTHLNSTVENSQNLVYMITRTFASAALVYLHVVVSGPRPRLPEIRESVTRTIHALQVFPDYRVASTLSWPLCIAGCMSLEEDEDFFNKFTSNERVGAPIFGNSGKVLPIIKKCWEMRKQGQEPGTIDWRSSMNSLNVDVLLV